MSGLGKLRNRGLSSDEHKRDPQTGDVGDKNETVHYFHHRESGVNRVFVDNPMFLQKVWGMAGGKIYDSVASTDNHDTQLCSVRNFVSIYYLHGSDKNGGGKNVDLWSLIGTANAVAECDHCFFIVKILRAPFGMSGLGKDAVPIRGLAN